MVGGAPWSRRNVKDQYPAVRMGHFLDIDPKPDDLEDFLRHRDRVVESLRPDRRPGRLVDDTQHEMPAAFVGKSNAVLIKLAVVELCPRCFELQPLVLRRRLTPKVDLFGCGGHVRTIVPRIRLVVGPCGPPGAISGTWLTMYPRLS